MKRKFKNTLRAMAKEIGVKVVFVNYFTDDIHGLLLPREKRILLNAHKPRVEHIFTLLHEIGHFLVHCKNPSRKYHLWIFDLNWKSERLARLSSIMRRFFRRIFNREQVKEWEADLWAFCAFICLTNRVGGRQYLAELLNRHPEKFGTFSLAAVGVAYNGLKTRLKNVYRALRVGF